MSPDVIDHLAGIAAGSHLDTVRALRVHARDNAQNSYLSLFAPADPGDVSLAERHAIAVFIATLHASPAIAAFYATNLVSIAAPIVAIEAGVGLTQGPYGAYPSAALLAENTTGPHYRVGAESRLALGEKLAAAFEHVHMLVFHPRDASQAALQTLLDAGWNTTGIVTLSQLTAFLAFQIRVVAGLRALAAA